MRGETEKERRPSKARTAALPSRAASPAEHLGGSSGESGAGIRFPRCLIAVVVIGFGALYGVSTSSYLSAFSSVSASFLFVPDIFFNVAVAFSVVATATAIVVLVLFGKVAPFSLPYWIPLVLMALAHIVVGFRMVSFLPAEVQLLIPALVYGFASVTLRLFWLEFFSVQDPAASIYQIVVGMVLGGILSTLLAGLAPTLQATIACALLLAIGCAAGYARRSVMGSLRAAEYPRAKAKASVAALRRRSREALFSIGNALVAFWVLEAVVGVLNSFMLAGQIGFAGSDSVTSFSRFAALLVFCVAAFAVQRLPQISTVSRIVMPVLAALLAFLPFLSEGYSLFFYTMLLGCYSFVSVLVTYYAVEAAHSYRVSPYVLMGVAMIGTRLCLAVALVVGYMMGTARSSVFGDSEDTLHFLIIVVGVIYLLSMAAVFLSRGIQQKSQERRWFETGVPKADPSIEGRCSRLAAAQGLTEREGEVLVLLAHGRTKAHIAESLFVTENTVRSHVRNIYTKLGVHTRQELIDLIETG